MSKFICKICGDVCEPYISAKYIEPLADAVMVRVYDIKKEEFNTKYLRTCRHCATAVRAYIDKLSRKLREDYE